ncbi:MAG: hypothetical protein ACQEV7_10380 [Bacillota bacterium]
MSKKKSHSTFVKEVYNLVGGQYTVLGKYKNNKTMVLMRHNNCKDGGSYEWNIRPDAFLHKGRRCEKCGGTKKLTNNEFLNRLYQIHKDSLLPMEKYINQQTHIMTLCKLCNHKWKVKPGHLLQCKSGCPKCSNLRNTKKKTLTNEMFSDRLKQIHGVEYIPKGHYKSMWKDRMVILHTKCGKEWEILPGSLLNGTGCKYCYGTPKKSHKDFLHELQKGHIGNDYELLSKYKGAHNKIRVRHKLCSYEWNVEAASLIKGTGCPNCTRSRGENKISTLLAEMGISFRREYTFNDCVYKNRLKFDFAIFDEESRINCLIEYHGIQHFKSVEFFGGEDSLKETIKRDIIKVNYCKNNNIPLLIFTYKDYSDLGIKVKKQLKKIKHNN